MKKQQYIYKLSARNKSDSGWENAGYFSSQKKAEKHMDLLMANGYVSVGWEKIELDNFGVLK